MNEKMDTFTSIIAYIVVGCFAVLCVALTVAIVRWLL